MSRLRSASVLPSVLVPAVLVLALGCAAPRGTIAGAHGAAGAGAVVYQTSTINALLEGAYDGDLSCRALLARGDFGLGTFHALDGEMVVLDGQVYQVRADGTVHHVDPDATMTPLAVVVPFRADRTVVWELDAPLDYAALQRRLDELLMTRNAPYAIRIDGDFTSVRTRSVPAQASPYPRLADVARSQPEFDLPAGRGTLVGFWFPRYLSDLNVPGYHFHYLTADRSAGGHVLDCRPTGRVRVQIQECAGLEVRLPRTEGFRTAPLDRDLHDELREVEQ